MEEEKNRARRIQSRSNFDVHVRVEEYAVSERSYRASESTLGGKRAEWRICNRSGQFLENSLQCWVCRRIRLRWRAWRKHFHWGHVSESFLQQQINWSVSIQTFWNKTSTINLPWALPQAETLSNHSPKGPPSPSLSLEWLESQTKWRYHLQRQPTHLGAKESFQAHPHHDGEERSPEQRTLKCVTTR